MGAGRRVRYAPEGFCIGQIVHSEDGRHFLSSGCSCTKIDIYRCMVGQESDDRASDFVAAPRAAPCHDLAQIPPVYDPQHGLFRLGVQNINMQRGPRDPLGCTGMYIPAPVAGHAQHGSAEASVSEIDQLVPP